LRRVNKPWGYEEIWAQTNNYIGKFLHINPGHRLSFQYHKYKEETIYVLKGPAKIWTGDGTLVLIAEGKTWHNEPGQKHRFGAPDDNKVVLVEVSTPHLFDVIRLEDDYER